jgi:hypothetical protein
MFVVVLGFTRSPRQFLDVLLHGAALQPHRDAMLRVGRPMIQGEGLEEQTDRDSLSMVLFPTGPDNNGHWFLTGSLILDRCIDRAKFLDSGSQHPLLCRATGFVGTPPYQSGCPKHSLSNNIFP